MNEIGSEKTKPWNIYTSTDSSPAQAAGVDSETPWKSFGTSMNAISFGFVATAILISMFLIMAIFEHIFRPTPSFSSSEDIANRSLELGQFEKLGHSQTVSSIHISPVKIL